MNRLRDDVRFALRGFVRAPAFTLAAAGTVALGIAAVTVMYAVIHALLFRPLPVPDPESLSSFELANRSGQTVSNLSYPQYQILREGASGLGTVAASNLQEYSVAFGEMPEIVIGADVTAEYFGVLGLRPAAGRFFVPEEDDVPGAGQVVVISYDLWQSKFGGSSAVIGRTLPIEGRPFGIVGVAPRGFKGTMIGMPLQVWIPISMYPVLHPDSRMYEPARMQWLEVMARLEPGVTRARAAARLSALAPALSEGMGTTGGGRIARVALHPLTAIPHSGRKATFAFTGLLMAAALLVLAIAAVNIAGMLLARGAARSREVSVRLALGASRRQVIAQFLTESALLFGLGAGLAVVLAMWLLGILSAWRPVLPVPLELHFGVDAGVVLFAAIIGITVGLLCGLAPALQASRTDLMPRIKGELQGPRGTRLRSVLVAGQITLSTVLLVCAALLGRSLQTALQTDVGFDSDGVGTGVVSFAARGYDQAKGSALQSALVERLRARPDVAAAGLAMGVPLGGDQYRTALRPEGTDSTGRGVDYNTVDAGYFAAVKIAPVLGRLFDDRDRGGPLVVVVNTAFTQRHWPGENPLGKRLVGRGESFEVVGVVPTAKYSRIDEDPTPFVYLNAQQRYEGDIAVLVRSRVSADAGVSALREELAVVDPTIAPRFALSLQQLTTMLLMPQRIGAVFVAGVGVLGLVLSAIGIYGLIAFTVTQRRREIGVRLALGARSSQVAGLFGRQGLRLLLIGATLGVLLSAAIAQGLRALLFGLARFDPVAFLGVPLLLAVVAAVAAWLPARRAARVDPIEVLRAE